jgi:hypothetical protein
MRVTAKRALAVLVFSGLGVGMMASAAQAYSVDASQFISPASTRLGSATTATGKLVYDPTVGPVPIPSPIYYQHAFPYYPYKRPTVVSTDWAGGPKTFNLTTDPVNGGNVWMASGGATIISKTTVNQQAKAVAEYVGSGYIRYGTGTGHTVDRNANNWTTTY